jgi:chromosome segregation ATPase
MSTTEVKQNSPLYPADQFSGQYYPPPTVPSTPPYSPLPPGESPYLIPPSYSQARQTNYDDDPQISILMRVWRWITSTDELKGKYKESLKKIQELEKELFDASEKAKQFQNLNQSLGATLAEKDGSFQALQSEYARLTYQVADLTQKNQVLLDTNARLEYEKNTAISTLTSVTTEKNRLAEMQLTLTSGVHTERERALSEKATLVSTENTQLKAKIVEIEKVYRAAKEREAKLQLDIASLKQSMELLQGSKDSIQSALDKEVKANQQLLRTIPKMAVQPYA